jgi:ferredoxin
MATLTERTSDNVPGRYYVDASCIACDQCCVMAPGLFARNEETGLSFVCCQPVTEEEIMLAEEALEACAVTAIGNDGVPASMVTAKAVG